MTNEQFDEILKAIEESLPDKIFIGVPDIGEINIGDPVLPINISGFGYINGLQTNKEAGSDKHE